MSGYLDTVLRRERSLVMAALFLLVLMSAVYTVAGSGMEMSAVSMTFGSMDAAGQGAATKMMPMAARLWSISKILLMFLMWWLMMVAMMLPSATPAVLLYAKALKRDRPDAPTPRAAIVFAAGYLLAWAGFSMAATGGQWGLEAGGLVSPSMMILVDNQIGALALMAVGAYQFTPLKDRCLTHCRAPAEFIARYHKPGLWGALRLGALHGTYCLGCCIALMALLFVGGVMNLIWILGLAVFVAIEKLGPGGRLATRVAGAGAIAFGILLFVEG